MAKTRTKCEYCVRARCTMVQLTMWTVIISITAIVVGILVFRPGYYAIQNMTGKANCTVVQTNQSTGEWVECGCGKNCRSHFRCSAVYVDYMAAGVSYSKVLLREHEEFFADSPRCSVDRCTRDVADSNRQIDEWLDEYGKISTSFPCIYNIEKPTEVIIEPNFSEAATIVSLAVPLSVAVIMILLNLYFFYLCWTSRNEANPFNKGRRSGFWFGPAGWHNGNARCATSMQGFDNAAANSDQSKKDKDGCSAPPPFTYNPGMYSGGAGVVY